MIDNILEPRAVGKLLQQEKGTPKFNFFIPSYQRGYRWDKEQVEDLLDDIFEFITTSKTRADKYCLQPIVVKQLPDMRYEVLDGQQRLTTIYILLSRLKKTNNEIDLFSLEYETRFDSEVFLEKGLDGSLNDTNPDYYYMSKAYIVIDDWIQKTKNIKPNITTSLFDAISESIEFIWYEIKNDVDAIDVFTRINIGKIPLTNAELVKAVFLSKNNLSLGYASVDTDSKNFLQILSLRQNAIALEWDQIEKKLQDPKVWGFIYGGTKNYDTRIDYLLDLSSKKQPSENNEYYSFKYFYDKVKNLRIDKELLEEYSKSNYSFIEQEWNALKSNYEILLEWYSDKTYNHLIGFLINQNESILEIIDDFKNNNRKEFIRRVKNKINSLINCNDISKLNYEIKSDYKKLERILLIHNVINSLLVDDNNIQFPYDRMRNKLWTLEHIFAQNSDELREDDYLNWLNDHYDFFKEKFEDPEAKLITNSIEKLISTSDKKIDKEIFEDCFSKVNSYIQKSIQEIDKTSTENNEIEEVEYINENEYDWINEDHSIANLALLDGSINSSIKNSLFDIKRKLILQKDKQGLFIPNETKKVFLKYYTPSPSHLAYWTYNDRKAYIESIKSSLNDLK